MELLTPTGDGPVSKVPPRNAALKIVHYCLKNLSSISKLRYSHVGLMKDLVDGRIDLTMLLQVTTERAAFIDYSHVTLENGLVLVAKKSDVKTNFSLLKLFRRDVWLTTWLIIALFFAWAGIIIIALYKSRNELFEIVFVLFASLINQGSNEIVKRISMRILIFTTLLFGFLGQNFIAANLTSSISVQLPSVEIKSLEDVEDLNYDLFITAGTSIEQVTKTNFDQKENSYKFLAPLQGF